MRWRLMRSRGMASTRQEGTDAEFAAIIEASRGIPEPMKAGVRVSREELRRDIEYLRSRPFTSTRRQQGTPTSGTPTPETAA